MPSIRSAWQDRYREGRFTAKWLTYGHTGQWVPLLAYGPGAVYFTGIHDNTQIPRIINELAGMDLFYTFYVRRSTCDVLRATFPKFDVEKGLWGRVSTLS